MSSTQEPATSADADDLIERLERTEQRREQARERVEAFGEAKIAELADAYEAFTDLLDRYEDQVVGDAGDVETNVEFQSQIAETVSNIPPDVLLRETFEDCSEYLKQKWFSDSDFEHVREQLEPVADIVARLEEYEAAKEAYRQCRHDITRRIRDLDDRIEDLDRLVELAEADLDAPIERLREPIEAYNETVTEAFQEFVDEYPARGVVGFLEDMQTYPLVPFEVPPENLRAYLREESPGEETIPHLLELAGYSRSKLNHYVDDPDRFEHTVARQKTYLSSLDAEPLRVDWPPPTAARLRWRCRELTAAVNRFDPSVVEALREVTALTRWSEYERVRTSAVAQEQLSPEERERIKSGSLEDELATARAERDRLRQALEKA